MSKPKHEKLWNKEWLQEELKKKPLMQIAEEVGCSYSGVSYAKTTLGLDLPYREKRRHSPTRIESIKKSLKKRFPEGRFGSLASNWRGGRRGAGVKMAYVQVYSPNHPNATNDGCVMEHRLKMEEKLGRYLFPYEVVHHKNGVKDDNRIENLEVFSRGDHTRHHFEDVKRVAKLEAELKQYKERFGKIEDFSKDSEVTKG